MFQMETRISRRSPNSRSTLVLGLAFLIGCLSAGNSPATGQEIKHMEGINSDRSLECVRRVLGKRPLIQPAVNPKWLIAPCPTSRSDLLDILKRDGLRYFDAGEFGYIIPSKFFPPLPPGYDATWPQVKWGQIKIAVQIRPAEGMDQKEADDIGREVLERARLIPLDADFNKEDEDIDSLQLNIYLYEAHLSPSSPTSVLAWVNQLPDASAGRFVYGEIRDGRYVMLWDSPLFSDAGNPGFQDVNGDGIEEIVMQTHVCGNECSDLLSIFDKGGRELTRQNNCGDSRPGWVCDIEGANISPKEAANGKTEMQVSGGDDGKDHVFKLVNGVYAPFPPFSKAVPLADKLAAAENDVGMRLMKEGDYERAAGAFVSAVGMIPGKKDSTTALFANNAGFAYYKMAKYEESVTWLKAAIEDDPQRAVAYANLGDTLVKLNRNAEARKAYTKYLELAPNSKSAPDVKKKLDALPAAP